MDRPRIAVVLGGGAARGLAHVGALDVLEREGVEIDFLAGSSMGGLVGALYATGLQADQIQDVARGFRFPSWFVPGGLVEWDRIFPTARSALAQARFETLPHRLAVVATDVESGRPVVLHTGPVLPAVRATCAVPAVLPPERVEGRWLVDGGLVSILPVDLAFMADPDVVVAVSVHGRRERPMPVLSRVWAEAGWRIGRVFPNPLTARAAFELLVRSAEIALDRQYTLAAAMIGPEVLVEVDIGTIGLRDFHRLDEAVAAGRRAMEAALPALSRALERPAAARDPTAAHGEPIHLDPVCSMVVTPRRAAASIEHDGRAYYFCSHACRDAFLRARGP